MSETTRDSGSVEAGSDELTGRAVKLFESELAKLVDSTPRSRDLFERARKVMPLGVASSFQAADPYPIYLKSGDGAEVIDVDGRHYIDYHNGFGSVAVGHAHPAVVAAIERAAHAGTHFAVTTELTVRLAEELCRRFRMERVRFVNSGTEATMDAIRVARGVTGRDTICKIEGSYHGHHDSVMFSVTPSLMLLEASETQAMEPPASRGIPAEMAKWTLAIPYNDLGAAEELFAARGSEIACLIIEPVMMNIGIVLPRPGYLEGLRELCTRYGIVLIFDEVKCGATIAAGGAIELFGVQPDLACFAKSVFGGTPAGAFGGRADLMDEIGSGIAQQGTFNGNPLVVAAGLATLNEVLTPDAYEHFKKMGARLAEGCRKAISEHSIPAHVVDLGCKGCVSYRPRPLVDYRSFLETNATLFNASWAWLVNRGIFMTPGNEEQWTLSVRHDESHIDRFIEVFEGFCAAVNP
jgi:glutamate-1-semialdehyde 2,1-aminomutase